MDLEWDTYKRTVCRLQRENALDIANDEKSLMIVQYLGIGFHF